MCIKNIKIMAMEAFAKIYVGEIISDQCFNILVGSHQGCLGVLPKNWV